jgi:hypothetical protein
MHFPVGIIFTGVVVYVAYRLGKSVGKEEVKETKIAKEK